MLGNSKNTEKIHCDLENKDITFKIFLHLFGQNAVPVLITKICLEHEIWHFTIFIQDGRLSAILKAKTAIFELNRALMVLNMITKYEKDFLKTQDYIALTR